MVHTIQLTLTIEVESEETKSAIQERLGSVNIDSLKESFEDTLDEFGDVNSVEVEW